MLCGLEFSALAGNQKMNRLLLNCFSHTQDINSLLRPRRQLRRETPIPPAISADGNLLLIQDKDSWSDESIQKLIDEN